MAIKAKTTYDELLKEGLRSAAIILTQTSNIEFTKLHCMLYVAWVKKFFGEAIGEKIKQEIIEHVISLYASMSKHEKGEY